jgi:hypothetical protein
MIRRGAVVAMVLSATLAGGADGQQVSAELTLSVSIPPMVRIEAVTSPAPADASPARADASPVSTHAVASAAHEAVFRVTANSSWKVDVEVDPAAGCMVTVPAGVHVSGGPDSSRRRLEGPHGTHAPIRVTCARPGARPHAWVVVARP